MNVFCTVITSDYIPFASNLSESIINNGSKSLLFVLISSFRNQVDIQPIDLIFPPNVVYLFFDDLSKSTLAEKMLNKYSPAENKDHLRWAMKPVLIHHLLNQAEIRRVFFVDCDIQFFCNPDTVFEKIPDEGVLLTPHRYPYKEPSMRDNFHYYDLVFKNGVFNAGAIGAEKTATDVINWWAKACLYRCDSLIPGSYVDQGHLTVMQALFCNVRPCTHLGFNVAWWNELECKRTLEENGQIRINHEYEIVFIHFARPSPDRMMQGYDPLIKPFLKMYIKGLQKNGLTSLQKVFMDPISIIKYKIELFQDNNSGKMPTIISETDITDKLADYKISEQINFMRISSPCKLVNCNQSVILTGSPDWTKEMTLLNNSAPIVDMVEMEVTS